MTKKLLTLILISLVAVTAAWGGSSSTLSYSSGNYGIGTTASFSRFQVDGTIYAGTTAPSQVSLTTSGNALFGGNVEIDRLVYLDGVLYGNGAGVTGVTRLVSGLATDSVPRASNSTTLVDSGIYATSGGMVGIGTTSSKSKLQVDGMVYIGTTAPSHTTKMSLTTSGHAMFGGNVEIDGLVYVDGAVYGSAAGLTGIPGQVSGLSTNSVPLASNSSTLVDSGIYASSGGLIGIGTAASKSKLQVDGTVYIGTTAPSHTTELNLTTSGNAMFGGNVEIDGLVYVDGVLYGNASGVNGVARLVSGLANNSVPRASNSSTLVDSGIYASSGGMVGIGTSSSKSRLQVDGMLYIGTTAPSHTTKMSLTTSGHAMFGGNVEVDGLVYVDGALYANGAGITGIPGQLSGLATNSVPRASNSTTLADSGIYTTSSGLLGIGTTASNSKLQVDGALYIGTIAPSHAETSLSTSGNAMFSRNVEIDGLVYIDDALYANGAGITGIPGQFSGLATNSVPRASGSSTLVDSGIYTTSGGMIGIGTASSKSKLQVDGMLYIGTTAPSHAQTSLTTSGNAMFGKNVEIDGLVYIDGALYADASHLSGISNSLTMMQDSTTNVNVKNGEAIPINFIIGGSQSMVLDANGNLAIGTSSPEAELDVRGVALFGTQSGMSVPTDHTMALTRSAGTSGLGVYMKGAGSSDTAIHMAANSSNLNIWGQNAGDFATFETSGRIGIGTISPSSTLEVNGPGSGSFAGNPSLLVLTAPNEHPWALMFRNTTYGSDPRGHYPYLSNGGALVTDTFDGGNSYTPLNLDEVGNVGIGTSSSPEASLHVYSSQDEAVIFDRASGPGLAIWQYTGGNGTAFGTESNDDLCFYANSGDCAVTLSAAGNIGLGTTDPYGFVEIQSALNPYTELGHASNYPLYIHSNNAVDGLGTGIAFSVSTLADNVGAAIILKRTDSSSKGELQFYTKRTASDHVDPVEAVVISDSGNIGIGTTAPTTLLHIASSSSAGDTPLLTLENTSGAALGAFGPSVFFKNGVAGTHGFRVGQYQSNDSRFFIAEPYNPWTEYLNIAQNGYVSIGTVTPFSKLDVDGALYIGTTAPSHAQTDLGTAGNAMFGGEVEVDEVLYVDGFIYGNASQMTGGIRSLTANTIPKAGSSTALVDSLIYDNGINVGIGSTSPVTKLNVAGTFLMSPVMLTSGATVNTDASLGNYFTLTATQSFTLANPINPVSGQKVMWRIKQDPTGNRVIALGGKFRLGTDIATLVLSTAGTKVDYLGAVYNSTDDTWDVIAFIKGY